MDDKAIPTATYEPNNDLDKEDFGDKNAYIDDYVEYVKKRLGDHGGYLQTKNLSG